MPEPAARRDLTVRDAILAAVEENSGVPEWRGAAAAGDPPVGSGSGSDEGSGGPPVEPPVERSDVKGEVRRHA
ncbi:hypothetical protein [Amycolatopsis sp. WQ 127309]|uniref:hypothetical protein n=1 Tax=Amycolatopsis sp. WQ 127309 TaxID=2932773 RepID=UPI001FF4B51C|nr:hypothetical protein [Amycolatopsis sp. WQ 127309]UOZ08412.1 hypothetical protein MUY22_09105 [Amycolatopsis sp. WQ 127309]